ncbi:hypothetical protein LOTGIDRAFT_69946, partial [Lottia gigantea]
PFKCDVCNKKFVQQEAPRVHMRIPIGEKPINVMFVKNVLHNNFLLGEKPFKCEVCEKGFTQESTFL